MMGDTRRFERHHIPPPTGSTYYTPGPRGVPEPAGATLVGLGVLGLLAVRIRLRRRGEA
jgi:hypothetical protein